MFAIGNAVFLEQFYSYVVAAVRIRLSPSYPRRAMFIYKISDLDGSATTEAVLMLVLVRQLERASHPPFLSA